MSNYAIQTRRLTRTLVTKTYNDRANFGSYDLLKLTTVKMKIDNAENELSILNEKIFNLDFVENITEEQISAELKSCQEYKDKIYECKAYFVTHSQNGNRLNSANSPSGENAPTNPPRSLLKSPVAPLPRFTSADGENLLLFLNQFEETLSKFSYTPYDRLLLLKQQVSGKASLLIESLEHDKQTYNDAKELLTAALASTEVQKYNVIKKLSELKLNYTDEPFQFISDVRKIMQAFTSLDLTVDDILSYFVYNGLNDTFKTQLTLITNNTKPNIKEIVDNFFKANERYEFARKSMKIGKMPVKSEPETVVMATNCNVSTGQNPFHNCTLCSNGSHAINRCTTYLKPQDKVARLKKLNACTNCANLDHSTDSCKFRFKKSCNLCQKWHFSFLCPERSFSNDQRNLFQDKKFPPKKDIKPPYQHGSRAQTSVNVMRSGMQSQNEQPEDFQNETEQETLCHIVCASYFQENTHEVDSVLSTFTVQSISGSHIRGLYDIGSQSSFVCENILDKFDYVILNNRIKLTINGINTVKTVKSKLIKLKLKFGNYEYEVKVLTVPSINIRLKLPNLNKVVSEFKKRGFHLADSLLNDRSFSLDDFGLMLGANAAFCFEGSTVPFGTSSVYLETKFGILILGSISDMMRDFETWHDADIPNIPPFEEGSMTNYKTSAYAINLGFALESSDIAECIPEGNNDHDLVVKNPDSLNFDKCSNEVLEETCSFHLNEEPQYSEENSELNKKLIRYLFENCSRAENGRLIFPLLWNSDVKHLLAKNFNLANKVLQSNLKKLIKDKLKFDMADENVKNLESSGIIQKIHNIDEFLAENPTCSFLAHSLIFKMDKETTKCRMVFMSNLAEKCNQQNQLSHNQCMHSGPSVNQKLTTSMLLLRFDSKLLCWDIKKAFLQIQLPEADSKKLCFLWYKNVAKGDYSLQAYKNNMLSFGLKPSPCILVSALYKMLIIDSENDDPKVKNLKRLIYSLTYMDNCAVSSDSSEELTWAFNNLDNIFSPYRFDLQQHCTNDRELQATLGCTNAESVKLFGLHWDTQQDILSPNKKLLDQTASTKRTILKSIAQNYDPYNFEGPILNRARLFMHELQCLKGLSWDQTLSKEQLREWCNIANQVNHSPSLCVPRCVGSRSDNYRLVCFTDASQLIYGCVVYVHNLVTNEVNFVSAKNRIVGKSHETKTIPSLELAAIVLGTETVIDVKRELTGAQCMAPILISDIQLYTDSLVCLNWLDSHVNKLDKMNKLTVFVKNRLDKVAKLCKNNPIVYRFVSGFENPADYISRPTSQKILMKSNYISGPSFLTSDDPMMSNPEFLKITVPNPKFSCRPRDAILEGNVTALAASTDARVAAGAWVSTGQSADDQLVSTDPVSGKQLVPTDRFSSLLALIRINEKVLRFVNNCKLKLKRKNPSKYAHIAVVDNTHEAALNFVLKCDQVKEFPDVFKYFNSADSRFKSVPNLVLQLNCFVDGQGLLRVGSKMLKNNRSIVKYCPILLSKTSVLTGMIIREYHLNLSHGGMYNILSELRKKYWLPCSFSTVKKVLGNCIHCKRFNARSVQLNQSGYKDFRLSPNNIPYSSIALDYAGPYRVRTQSGIQKVYVLVVTCLFTRCINLKVSIDMTTVEFLRSFQLHCHEQGLPQFILHDMGSNLVAGADIISNFLAEPQTISYFNEIGTKMVTFQHYYKGCHKLGSLVETCVKAIRRLISGAIKNNVLQFRDFEFIASQTIHLVNRRPIAYKESLRDNNSNELPQAITPEILLHGFDLTSVNIIPSLQSVDLEQANIDENFSPTENIRDSYVKLRNIRSQLMKLYNEEFLPHLISQATDDKTRYKPKLHKKLCVNDIVLIKEENVKQTNMPMAIVESITTNELGECTGAIVRKGTTGERVKRHATVLIPLLQMDSNDLPLASARALDPVLPPISRPRRVAAINSEQRTRALLDM